METEKIMTSNATYNNAVIDTKKSTAKVLKDLFIDFLKDIYWAEKAQTMALPKMIKNATSPKLAIILIQHLGVTEEQVSTLEDIFASIDEDAVAKRCDAMEGLIEEAEGMLEETERGAVRDAAIIAATQKIKHYEIATYGTLVAFAKTLDEEEAVELLEQILNEEKEADVSLTEAALSTINFDATAADEE
jgi:ferritin-like metal-binding protein YciE